METKMMICAVCGGRLLRDGSQYICESCGTVEEIHNDEQEFIPQDIWTQAKKLVADAHFLAQNDGLIQTVISTEFQSSLTAEQSTCFSSGYASPRFGNEDERVVCWKPYLLTVTGENTVYSLLSVLEQIAEADLDADIIFFADKADALLLETLSVNWERGTLHCMAILLPEDQSEHSFLIKTLERLGSRILDSATAKSTFYLNDMGKVGRAIVTPGKTFLLDEKLNGCTPIVTIHAGGKNETEQDHLLKACRELLKDGGKVHV